MNTLNCVQVREMLLHTAAKIIDSKPYLTEVDSKIGDGDHGIGMSRGMEKATEKLNSLTEATDVYQLFSEMGKTLLMSMGGASGVIFGTMFMGGAKGKTPTAEISAADFTAMMNDSLNAIIARGGAHVGDKTMIDALSPAVDALKANAEGGYAVMLHEAEKAARSGMENTKNFQAKFGRAKSLMERSIGYQDAGATSVWLIFQAMSEYVEGAEK
ncbi:MAG: dihydroxyacetone kinase subunit DhaL [Oscillospiraceae bacterium]|nr:dihydroxyacetone kinase subunit DhaL [Oscillospiraceae bacterium]